MLSEIGLEIIALLCERFILLVEGKRGTENTMAVCDSSSKICPDISSALLTSHGHLPRPVWNMVEKKRSSSRSSNIVLGVCCELTVEDSLQDFAPARKPRIDSVYKSPEPFRSVVGDQPENDGSQDRLEEPHRHPGCRAPIKRRPNQPSLTKTSKARRRLFELVSHHQVDELLEDCERELEVAGSDQWNISLPKNTPFRENCINGVATPSLGCAIEDSHKISPLTEQKLSSTALQSTSAELTLPLGADIGHDGD